MAITKVEIPKAHRRGGGRGRKIRITDEELQTILSSPGTAFRLDDYKSLTPALKAIGEMNDIKFKTRIRLDENGDEVLNNNGKPLRDIYAIALTEEEKAEKTFPGDLHGDDAEDEDEGEQGVDEIEYEDDAPGFA